MDVISTAIYVCELAVLAIVLYWVVPLITTMPPNMQTLVQVLIILIAICAAIHAVVGSPPLHNGFLGFGGAPSIIAPERK